MNQLITKNDKNLVLAGITISKYWYSDCTNSKSWKKNSLTGIYECVRNCPEKVDTSQSCFFTFPFSFLVHIFLVKILIISWSYIEVWVMGLKNKNHCSIYDVLLHRSELFYISHVLFLAWELCTHLNFSFEDNSFTSLLSIFFCIITFIANSCSSDYFNTTQP